MNRTFGIFPDQKLMIARFIGPIDFYDIRDWIDEAPRYKAFSTEYDGIVDQRRAIFKHTRIEKAKELATYMVEHRFTSGKWVVLVTKPMETALSLLYREIAVVKHPIELFSTIDAAAKYLERNVKDLVAIDPLLSNLASRD